MASVLQVETIKPQDGAANAIEIANSSANVTINNLAGGAIGSGVTGFTGIKMYDNWRLVASLESLSTPTPANLERNDTADAGLIGSAMTVSSGIWTFPQTGIYLIGFHPQFYLNNSAQYIGFAIKKVISGSASFLSKGYGFVNRTNTSSTYNSVHIFATFDVTDTSTHKIRFDYDESHSATAYVWGSTSYNGTHFTFMRIGDT